MEKKNGILLIGGDKRQIVAENCMHQLGWKTSVCMVESQSMAKGTVYTNWNLAARENRILVFPLPISKKGIYLNSSDEIPLAHILDCIQTQSLVFGGKLSKDICSVLEQKELRYFDYYNDEFQIRNALPTAEAAIGIALLESPRVLLGARSLVVGYGKIGKVLSQKLQLFGVNVTVGARKLTDLALAKNCGHAALSIANGIPDYILDNFDFIFNTVPVRLFGRKEMSSIKAETLFIELASFPYGIDIEMSKEYPFRTILAESLPGKYSPISAGEILAETVVQILEKEGISP